MDLHTKRTADGGMPGLRYSSGGQNAVQSSGEANLFFYFY